MALSVSPLTTGAIPRMMQERKIVEGCILQIVDSKSVAGDRFRITAMLPMVLNERVRNGEFPLLSIIQVKSGAVQEMSPGKFVFFIVAMDLLQVASFKYGQPAPYTAGAAPPAPAADAQMHYAPPPPVPQYGQSMPPPQAYSGQQQSAAPAYGGGGAGAGGYYQPPQQQQQQLLQPQYGGAAPIAPAGGYGAAPGRGGAGGPDLAAAGATIQPITTLNPYGSRWTIKARVTSKTDVKSWNNAKGAGTLFSIDLLDEWGGEIRATFFKEASDKFFPLISVGRVYLFSGGSLKVANKKFTSIRNEYELQFSERSSITPVDDDGRISTVQFNLVKINVLDSVPADTMVDVAGVVLQPGQATTINTKAGKSMLKRDVQIADETGHAITLTLWDTGAAREFPVGAVIALKGAKLGAFGGRSLSTYGSTIIEVDPAHVPATQMLKAWYASGAAAGVRSISEERSGGGGGTRDAAVTSAELRKTVAGLRENENICATDRDSHCVKAMITYIKTAEPEKLWYPACPSQVEGRSGTCNKKMMENAGSWACPNGCNTSQPVYRYIMSCKVQDWTGASFVTFFDQEAKELLGHSADDMRRLLIQSGSAEPSPEFEAIFRGPQNRDLLIWANVKNEMVKDEYRLKVAAKRARPVSYAQECRALLELLKKYPTA